MLQTFAKCHAAIFIKVAESVFIQLHLAVFRAGSAIVRVQPVAAAGIGVGELQAAFLQALAFAIHIPVVFAVFFIPAVACLIVDYDIHGSGSSARPNRQGRFPVLHASHHKSPCVSTNFSFRNCRVIHRHPHGIAGAGRGQAEGILFVLPCPQFNGVIVQAAKGHTVSLVASADKFIVKPLCHIRRTLGDPILQFVNILLPGAALIRTRGAGLIFQIPADKFHPGGVFQRAAVIVAGFAPIFQQRAHGVLVALLHYFTELLAFHQLSEPGQRDFPALLVLNVHGIVGMWIADAIAFIFIVQGGVIVPHGAHMQHIVGTVPVAEGTAFEGIPVFDPFRNEVIIRKALHINFGADDVPIFIGCVQHIFKFIQRRFKAGPGFQGGRVLLVQVIGGGIL